MISTVRKTGIGLLTLFAIALTTLLIRDVRSDDGKAGTRHDAIEGAWTHIEAKNGPATEYQKLPEGQEFIICITGGRFIWARTADGKLLASVGGKYKVDKDKYSEIIEWVHGDGVPE